MDKLLLQLTTSLSLLNPNPQTIIVHSVAPAVCSSVAGVLDSRGACIFPKQLRGKETVIAVPTVAGCEILDTSDESRILISNNPCDTLIGSIAHLRNTSILERLKQLFQ